MDCKTCKESRQTIPYIAHEAAMARMERTNKRTWIAVIILIVLLVASNVAWMIYESQFETVPEQWDYEVTQEADSGDNNYSFVGGDYIGTAND